MLLRANSILLFGIVLTSIFTIIGCNSNDSTSKASPSITSVSTSNAPTTKYIQLNGTSWELLSIAGIPTIKDFPQITIELHRDYSVIGNTGCHLFSGSFIAIDTNISITGDIIKRAKTQEVCSFNEEAFVQVLKGMTSYEIVGNDLQLKNADGDVTLMFQSILKKVPIDPKLEDSFWYLLSINGKSLIEETAINLSVRDWSLDGSGGCSRYSRPLKSIINEKIMFNGDIDVNQQLCSKPVGIMEQEKVFLDALINAETYTIQNGQLEISNAYGETTLLFVTVSEPIIQ